MTSFEGVSIAYIPSCTLIAAVNRASPAGTTERAWPDPVILRR
jgi:hypothetical protein